MKNIDVTETMKIQALCEKIRLIVLPFLLLSAGMTIGYSAFRWLFEQQLGLLVLKDDVMELWIPFALVVLALAVFVRRWIRLLNLEGKRGDYAAFYFAVIGLVLGFPLVISQKYVSQAFFSLIQVKSPAEIEAIPGEKYFTIDRFQVDKQAAATYLTSRVSGRTNERLLFHLFVAAPFENTRSVWCGVEYSSNISNRSSTESKMQERDRLVEKAQSNYESLTFGDVVYFEKLPDSEERDGCLNAVRRVVPDDELDEQVILTPRREQFDERLGDTFGWIFGAYAIGGVGMIILVAIPGLKPEEVERFTSKESSLIGDFREALQWFATFRQNKAIITLLAINILVFLTMVVIGISVVSPTPQELLELGGNRRAEVLNGEVWRLLTSMFLHGGVMHLVYNICALGVLGFFVESIFGIKRLLLVYIPGGLAASLSSIYWNENVVSVGASGAIMALSGLLLVLVVAKVLHEALRGMALTLAGLFGGISLLMGLGLGGIDNAAHIGGLCAGIVIAIMLTLFDKDQMMQCQFTNALEKLEPGDNP